MSDIYRHGVYVSELETSLIPMTQVAGPTVAFGTAPTHLAKDPAAANTPVLCHTLGEFVNQFGWSDDFDTYTLCEVAHVSFQLFNVAPVVFVNVLDTEKHSTTGSLEIQGLSSPVTIEGAILLPTLKITTGQKADTATIIGVTNAEPITIPAKIDSTNFVVSSGDVELSSVTDYSVANGKIQLTNAGLEKINGNLTFTSGVDTYAELVNGTDYTAAYDSKGNTILTVLATDKVVDDEIYLSFNAVDASAVTASDIIGGVDVNTGKNLGIELAEEVFPRFGVIPNTLIAPKFSCESGVAGALKAKCESLNGCFRSFAAADLDTTKVRKYTDVTAVKTGKNFVDPFLAVTWPKVALGGVQTHLSTQLAALIGKVDSAHNDIPYKSPSNESIQADQTLLADGTDVFLGKSQANYLNGQGVVTALNFIGGFRMWGNRTSQFPATSDPKDSFISERRLFNWISNTLVVNFWSKIDEPLNARQIESVVDSANIWFNGLTARGAILGGRVAFLEEENPRTDLMDGIARFHVYVAGPPPMREVDFITEFDVNYFSTLVG